MATTSRVSTKSDMRRREVNRLACLDAAASPSSRSTSRSTLRRCSVVLALVVATEAFAGDNPPGDYYGDLAATVKAKLDALVAAHAPKLVPPVPIKPAWKAAKVGSIDLGAPLVAFAAANLDGDPSGLCINRVLDQLLYNAGRTLHYFTRRDLIRDVYWQQADAIHRRTSSLCKPLCQSV